MPDVTVSIVAGGDGRLLDACLASLPGAARTTTLETIVVDNASPEPLAVPDGVELIRNDARRGFGANHNAVLARAEGDTQRAEHLSDTTKRLRRMLGGDVAGSSPSTSSPT